MSTGSPTLCLTEADRTMRRTSQALALCVGRIPTPLRLAYTDPRHTRPCHDRVSWMAECTYGCRCFAPKSFTRSRHYPAHLATIHWYSRSDAAEFDASPQSTALDVEAQHAAIQRHRHRLRTILHLELGKDVQEMSLDCCFTDEQRGADVLVGSPPGHVHEDFDLACAESLVPRGAQAVPQARHDRWREDRGAGRGRPDGPKELFAGGVLEQVPRGAYLNHRQDVSIGVVGRQHEDVDVGMAPADPRRGGDAVNLGHSQVHQEDMGTKLARQVDGLDAGARLSDDFEVRLRFEHGAQSRADDEMIIGNHKADLHAGLASFPTAASTRLGPVGSSTTSVQPRPGALSTLSEPFSISMRSRMVTSPSPPSRPGGRGCATGSKPTPSSHTSSTVTPSM